LIVNALPLRSPLTGIGQYTLQLFSALASQGGIDAHYFYGSHWSQTLQAAHSAGIDQVKQVIKRVVPYPYAVTRTAQSLAFAAGVRRLRPQLYHEPNYLALPFKGPLVVTIHDLSLLHMPEAHPEDRVRNWRRHFRPTLERATHILTDSAFVRDEVIHALKVEPDRVTAAPIACDAVFYPRQAADTAVVLQRHGLRHDGYLLAVGTLEPRKNLAAALTAYASLPAALQRAYPFIIAGREGWLTEGLQRTIDRLTTAGQLRFLGFVAQSDLPVLYAGARAFVYPSRYEGFGLPVLEALASGLPVVTSTAASLPEVAGDAALCVPPDDHDALATALTQALDDSAVRQCLIGRAAARAASFSWQRCAALTRAVYQRVL
jgi:alpha-1,3-rhamnosyl/mannosyltransferase